MQNTAILGSTSTAWRTRTGGPRMGVYTANGDGSRTVFAFPHSLGSAPTYKWTEPVPGYPASFAPHTVATDGTNVTVTFTTAPPVGTGNVRFNWAVTGYGLGVGYPG